MAQGEVGEVAEPSGGGRGGSSAMPHKRNPVAAMVALAGGAARAAPRRRAARARWRRSTSAASATGRPSWPNGRPVHRRARRAEGAGRCCAGPAGRRGAHARATSTRCTGLVFAEARGRALAAAHRQGARACAARGAVAAGGGAAAANCATLRATRVARRRRAARACDADDRRAVRHRRRRAARRAAARSWPTRAEPRRCASAPPSASFLDVLDLNEDCRHDPSKTTSTAAWRTAARCSATPGSTSRSPARPSSTPSSRA